MFRIEAGRVRLAHLPTPLHELKNVTGSSRSPRVLVKRDDLTGLALGGNKVRKLEFLLADAIDRGATAVVTAGAAQSNHCRQTAAAAAMLGLPCVLLLGGAPPDAPNGNLLLDKILGATIIWTGTERQGESLDRVARILASRGHKPYIIPYGGSNPVGATGYVAAMGELMEQLSTMRIDVDFIIIPTSSCGTQAGIIVGSGIYGYHGSVLGISVDKDSRDSDAFISCLVDLCNGTAMHCGVNHAYQEKDVHVNFEYTGKGYGITGDLETRAIRILACREGILLDPVYTGRAMGGLLDLIGKKMFPADATILFWHTGGIPALFAYADQMEYKDNDSSDTRIKIDLN